MVLPQFEEIGALDNYQTAKANYPINVHLQAVPAKQISVIRHQLAKSSKIQPSKSASHIGYSHEAHRSCEYYSVVGIVILKHRNSYVPSGSGGLPHPYFQG